MPGVKRSLLVWRVSTAQSRDRWWGELVDQQERTSPKTFALKQYFDRSSKYLRFTHLHSHLFISNVLAAPPCQCRVWAGHEGPIVQMRVTGGHIRPPHLEEPLNLDNLCHLAVTWSAYKCGLWRIQPLNLDTATVCLYYHHESSLTNMLPCQPIETRIIFMSKK